MRIIIHPGAQTTPGWSCSYLFLGEGKGRGLRLSRPGERCLQHWYMSTAQYKHIVLFLRLMRKRSSIFSKTSSFQLKIYFPAQLDMFLSEETTNHKCMLKSSRMSGKSTYKNTLVVMPPSSCWWHSNLLLKRQWLDDFYGHYLRPKWKNASLWIFLIILTCVWFDSFYKSKMISNKNTFLIACINYGSNSKIKNKIKCFKNDSYSRYNMKIYEIWLLSFSVLDQF